MLVEEVTTGSVPKHLELTLSSLESPDLNDVIVVLLYTLMIESGFIPADAQNVAGDISTCYGYSVLKLNTYTKLPKGWKNDSGNLYEMKFQIAPLSSHRCQLLVLPMQDLLVVDLFIERQSGPEDNTFFSCFTMTVCPSTHISIENPLSGCAIKYNNIQKLARKFKETIAYPARASILTDCGVTNPSLMGLPDEVTLKILEYLHIEDIGSVSQVCTFLNELTKDRHLWHYLYMRDYKPSTPPSIDVDCASLYKMSYNGRNGDTSPVPGSGMCTPHPLPSRFGFLDFGLGHYSNAPKFHFHRSKRSRLNSLSNIL